MNVGLQSEPQHCWHRQPTHSIGHDLLVLQEDNSNPGVTDRVMVSKIELNEFCFGSFIIYFSGA
jgi:hypothetical protein